MEKRISGHTGLLALIGSPVGHSGSPADVQSVSIHLVHESHYKSHCDIVKRGFTGRREANLYNLSENFSGSYALGTVLCLDEHSAHCGNNNQIDNT